MSGFFVKCVFFYFIFAFTYGALACCIVVMYIEEITAYTPEIEQAIVRFLKQLVHGEVVMTDSLLKELICSTNSHLFCAVDAKKGYVGMITVGIYLSPTGRKAWIEDVVVTETSRGQGIGEELTKYAIDFAKGQGVQSLMLTSNPTRVAANRLYQKLGFEQRETNVYRMIL